MEQSYNKIKNIWNSYFINVSLSCWFISSVWLFYWLNYFTYTEIGYVDAITVLIVFVLGIPLGALADLIGRKKVLTISFIAMFVGIMLQTIAWNKIPIAIGNLVFNIGYAGQTGSLGAIIYDSLKQNNMEAKYPQYYSRTSTFSIIANILCLVLGGLTFNINQRLPFLLWALSYLFGLIFVLKLNEPPRIATAKISLKSYFKQNWEGIRGLVSGYLLKFLPFTLIVLGFSYTYDWSSLRPAIGQTNGLDGYTQSMIFAFSLIPETFIVQLIPLFRRKISDKVGSIILCLAMASMFVFFGMRLGPTIAVPMIIISSISALSYAWMIMIINDHTDSKHRATVVGGMYTILKLPYIFLAIVSGQIIEAGHLTDLNLAIAAIIGVTAVVLAFQHTSHKAHLS